MSLFLIEASLDKIVSGKEELNAKVEELQTRVEQSSAILIEVQVSKDFKRSYFIIEANEETEAKQAITDVGIEVALSKEVRLVGEDLEDVKAEKDVVNYLVEWNLPENLTMDQYLARKTKNSVHYEEVPEVEFARTYVCEDMTKCLCFYDAPDEAAVKRAREAVQAPIDAITELGK